MKEEKVGRRVGRMEREDIMVVSRNQEEGEEWRGREQIEEPELMNGANVAAGQKKKSPHPAPRSQQLFRHEVKILVN